MGRSGVMCLTLLLGIQVAASQAAQTPVVVETARKLPVAYKVDVVVVGGSTGGVAAAAAAAKSGAKVLLISSRPYLGEDMAGTLQLWLLEGEEPKDPLAKALYAQGSPARPLHVKRTLDKALLDAGVEFLYWSYATDVLRDAEGKPAGIVMANRAGRQAVIAKRIIDATNGGWVARMAGARGRPAPPGPRMVTRVVIGGEPRSDNFQNVRTVGAYEYKDKEYPIHEYALTLGVRSASFANWAELEQQVRDLTYTPEQQFSSDMLYHIPVDPITCEASARKPVKSTADFDPKVFRPADVPNVVVLSGAADMLRANAQTLMRPSTYVEVGTRLGAAIGAEAKAAPEPKGVRLPGDKPTAMAAGDVHEVLVGVRPTQDLPTLDQETRSIPVLGQYDVVVVGGGTSGAPAGIGAAREGAKTLVLEYLYGLGGVGTQGAISSYYHGYRGGFTGTVPGGGKWQIEQKAEWWRSELLRAGAKIWFGVLGCGTYVSEGRVQGVIVATPQGRGVVLAKVVVDSTGNADIAAAAGAPCVYIDGSDLAVQGTGLPPRELGASYTNTDFTQTDETDMIDITSLFVYAKTKYSDDSFDQGQLIDTRERRRIVGDYTISVLDQVRNRTYSDTIAQTKTNFDTHGYTVDDLFLLNHPDKQIEFTTFVPYRALLPKGLDGILVTGLAVSAHRDAVPLIRMQPDLQNLGYAAGVAAARVAKEDIGTRSINIRKLQEHLVEIGNIPKSALTDEDMLPPNREQIGEAIEKLQKGYDGVSILLANSDLALPMVQRAYGMASSDEAKLRYAHVLGLMGDTAGIQTLTQAVDAIKEWDKGWNFKGMGQFGGNMSHLDSLIVALGSTKDKRALKPILTKVELLDAEKDFSHHRAVALALEKIGDPAATEPLARLLQKPGMSGHAHVSIAKAVEAHEDSPKGLTAEKPRRESLRELMLARALYRCGDKDGMGRKILESYEKDIRGHFSRHAYAVLGEGK